ncbi:hypothetical protein HDA40_005836 [Hamadaea flava]|uniref:Uncharacterized protein n=1 Tax=Hamadaea flava TaxID=1742688 RepID=A0ABV8LRL6_9ACTN|nr:hypothetical protein [Hamadaea flava]MCP2327329.1 hypothetical protein [Hamadaea flava]
MIVPLIPDTAAWDWDILSYNGATLVLAAAPDLTYGHHFEVAFTDLSYLALPASFDNPEFREPTAEETAYVARCIGEQPRVLVAFDIDAMSGGGKVSCLVAADACEVREGFVPRGGVGH